MSRGAPTVHPAKYVTVCFLGVQGVGKSSLVNAFFNNQFATEEERMSESKYENVTHNGHQFDVEYRDPTDFERTSTASFYNKAAMTVMVFAIDHEESLNRQKETSSYAERFMSVVPLRLCVATKSDITNGALPDDVIQSHIASLGCSEYLRVSTATGEGVRQLHDRIIAELYEKYFVEEPQPKKKKAGGCLLL